MFKNELALKVECTAGLIIDIRDIQLPPCAGCTVMETKANGSASGGCSCCDAEWRRHVRGSGLTSAHSGGVDNAGGAGAWDVGRPPVTQVQLDVGCELHCSCVQCGCGQGAGERMK
ncbi:hypothetical protein C8R45DRAFT_927667 [Mycena sanguinolenta]|nr:hypothetical protein C8R45DRAFT_927667 [Mycena sanguinolenta]